MRIRNYAGLAIVALLSGLLASGAPASAASNCYWAPDPGRPGYYTLEGDLSNCVIGPVPGTPAPSPMPSETAMPTPTPTPVVVTPPTPTPTQQPVPVVAPTPTPTPTLNAEAIAKADAADKAKKAAEALAKLQAAAADLEKANNDLQRATDEALAALDKVAPRTATSVSLRPSAVKIIQGSQISFISSVKDADATGSITFDLEVSGRTSAKLKSCPTVLFSLQPRATCTFVISENVGSSYTYTLTAKYSGDENYSAASTSYNFIVLENEGVKPCQPYTDLIASGDETATVYFTPAIYPGCGVPTSYQVRKETTDKVLCETNSLECKLKGLTNDVPLIVYLVAINAFGDSNSNLADRIKDVIIPIGKPPAPQLVVARTLNSSKIRVIWQGGVTNGGSAITSFVATSNDGTLQCTNPATLQAELDSNIFSCDIEKPVVGQKYTFTVKGLNKYGTSIASPSSNEISTSSADVEKFQHKISVADGFVVLSIKLNEVGNPANQVICVRVSSCSILVPKNAKWNYSVEDEFANKIIDNATKSEVSDSTVFESTKDTSLVIFSEQEKSLVIASRDVTNFKLISGEVYPVWLEVGAYVVVRPLFTTKSIPYISEAYWKIPTGTSLSNGVIAGIPTKTEFMYSGITIDDVRYGLAFGVNKFTYGSPEGVVISSNGGSISYTVKPNTSSNLADITNRANKWEVQFFNSTTDAFIGRSCKNSLTGTVEIGPFAGVYAKAFSGCAEMLEPAYENYRISAASAKSNTVVTRTTITYSGSSKTDPVVTSNNIGDNVNLSFSVKPLADFSLVPATPFLVSESEMNNFAASMSGLKIDSNGKITGAINPTNSTKIIGEVWEKSFKTGDIQINFTVKFILLKIDEGTFKGGRVSAAAAAPVGSGGSVSIEYKPVKTGIYKFTLELVTSYPSLDSLDGNIKDAKGIIIQNRTEVISLGSTEKTFNDLNSAPVDISFNSNRLKLAGYLYDPDKKGYLPYQLPVVSTYRVRAEAITFSVQNVSEYFSDLTTSSFSPNLALTWPKPLAPKPSTPTVEATSKKGEILVGGIISAFWDYPDMPVSVTINACRVKNLSSCTTKIVTSFGSKATVSMTGLLNEDYKVRVTLNIDPANKELATGPASGWSKTVKPKK